MFDRTSLKELAKLTGLRQTDLVPMAPGNDPYLADTPSRLAGAEWFSNLFDHYGFRQGVHLRRVHYRIISSETPVVMPDGSVYENTDKSWKFLGSASRDARYLGLVDSSLFEDHRNPDPIIYAIFNNQPTTGLDGGDLSWSGISEDFPDPPNYTFSGKPDYPYHIEIWCEKTTMNDVLLPICEAREINLITGMGELSEVATRLLVDRALSSKKPVRILYISDFDPAGRSMPLAVSRRTQYVIDRLGLNMDLRLIPLVLTEKQCIDFRLPRTPIKETEMRAAKFEARFGSGATELDALEALHPGKLKSIVSTAINRYRNPSYQRLWHQKAGEYQNYLTRWNNNVWNAIEELPELKERYDHLQTLWDEFEVDAGEVFGRVSTWLAESPPDDFKPPEHPPR